MQSQSVLILYDCAISLCNISSIAAVVCGAITAPANGDVAISSDTASFSCKDGYAINGPATSTCDTATRKWGQPFPTCSGRFACIGLERLDREEYHSQTCIRIEFVSMSSFFAC